MSQLTIELAEGELEYLQEEAKKSGVSTEALAARIIRDFAKPAGTFADHADFRKVVLESFSEYSALYKRLAK